MNSYKPKLPYGYKSLLTERETECAIQIIKTYFQGEFANALNLTYVCGPIAVLADTGINDNLDGTMQPVSFTLRGDETQKVEIVQSLAKWKRVALAHFGFHEGEGLFTNMIAIRPDERIDNIHSLYVDQWDWERVIAAEERNLESLKEIVRRIYEAIKKTESYICEKYPQLTATLPDEIVFSHTEDIEDQYPHLTPKEREDVVTKEYGAVFLIGIGAKLKSGLPHEDRAPDYDDWITPTIGEKKGLNGDILVWNPEFERAFELSSMGIRVDPDALLRQLKLAGRMKRRFLPIHLPEYHTKLLHGELPLSIGGGIGQSRLCMFLLRKVHIGEVQFSIWPDSMRAECERNGIFLR